MLLSELQQLFRFLEQDRSRYSNRNHLMFKFLATSGIRRQELVNLTWQQIDLENRFVRIFDKKSGFSPSPYGCSAVYSI
nr:site-specific integrase [Anoxybacillus vitaminiphilus]